VFFHHEYLFRRRCSEIFRNLLQGGDGTSAKKLDEDLDILWRQKGAMYICQISQKMISALV